MWQREVNIKTSLCFTFSFLKVLGRVEGGDELSFDASREFFLQATFSDPTLYLHYLPPNSRPICHLRFALFATWYLHYFPPNNRPICRLGFALFATWYLHYLPSDICPICHVIIARKFLLYRCGFPPDICCNICQSCTFSLGLHSHMDLDLDWKFSNRSVFIRKRNKSRANRAKIISTLVTNTGKYSQQIFLQFLTNTRQEERADRYSWHWRLIVIWHWGRWINNLVHRQWIGNTF